MVHHYCQQTMKTSVVVLLIDPRSGFVDPFQATFCTVFKRYLKQYTMIDHPGNCMKSMIPCFYQR